jgi:hypothetical protein
MKFLSDILAKAGLVVDGVVTLNSVANATTDTDKFIVIDSGVVKYRTGAQLIADVQAQLKSDYAYNITGTINSTNKVFTLSNNFIAGTTRVYVNGIRLTPGASYDYTEANNNQIVFTNAPDPGDLITVDYIKS